MPFTPDQLAALYPSHRQFLAKWNEAARRAVKAGFLLEADAEELQQAVARSDIGNIEN